MVVTYHINKKSPKGKQAYNSPPEKSGGFFAIFAKEKLNISFRKALEIMNTVIGISGVAGAGKDLFFSILKKTLIKNNIPVHRYALADELKKEIAPMLQSLYGVDINSCDRETKDFYRPLLVFHGRTRREKTSGRYWTNKLNEKILSEKREGVICITDIRYDDYEKDEISWIRDEMNGVLVHISQYEVKHGEPVRRIGINDDEKRFDPILKQKSDYRIEWERLDASQDSVEASLLKHIEAFLSWLNKNERLRLGTSRCG